MPKIEIDRTSQRVRTPSSTLQPRASAAGTAISGAAGIALQQRGQVQVQQGLERSFKIKEENDRIRVARDNAFIVDASTRASQKILRQKQNMQQGLTDPAGFAESFMGQVDSINAEIAATAPSKEAAAQFQLNSANARMNLFSDALKFENVQSVSFITDEADSRINEMGIDIARDPANIVVYSKNILDEVEIVKSVNNPEVGRKFEENAKRTIANSHIAGLTGVSEDEALAAISKGTFDEALTLDELEKHKKQIISHWDKVNADQQTEAKNISSARLTEYAIDRAEGQKISIEEIKTDPKLTNEGKRQAFRLAQTSNKAEDDLPKLIEANQKLSNGTLTTKWITDNSEHLRPETVRNLVKDITSDISGNPAYKSGVKRIDTLFVKDPLSFTGLLKDPEEETLKLEYMERLKEGVSKGENVENLSTEIIRNHSARKLEMSKDSTKKDIVKRVGGESKMNTESLNSLALEINKKIKRRNTLHQSIPSYLKEEQRAILELLKEVR
jgi:hypothetical protein